MPPWNVALTLKRLADRAAAEAEVAAGLATRTMHQLITAAT